MTTRFWATVGLVIAVCAATLLTGCEGTNQRPRASSRNTMGLVEGTDQEALRADLVKFVDLYSAVVAGSMGEVAAQTRERQTREYAFLVRARQIPRARTALLDDDPREAFVRIWAQVAYNRYWSVRGTSGLIFHEFAPMLEQASITLEEAILKLALRHFPEQTVVETRERLESTIRSLPPGSDLSPPSDELIAMARTSSGNPFSVLLVPLRPLSGVGDVAESIAKLAQVSQAAMHFVKEVPLLMRWQAEMLLFEIDEMSTMVTLREESTRLSTQLAALSVIAEDLPSRIRAETEILLQTADASTARLGQTFEAAQRITEQINSALVQAEHVSESLLTTSQAITGTMDTTRGVLGDLERLRMQAGEDGEMQRLDLVEVNRVAENLERAASEARALLADLGQPLGPESGVSQTIDRASVELDVLLKGMLNGLLWRGAALIGLAFFATLAFHAITRGRGQATA